MVVARVILKGAKSYRHGGRRFIKDVPQTLKGDEVSEYLENGYFHVSILKGKVEPAAVRPSSDEHHEKKSSHKSVAEIAGKKTGGTGLKKRT